MKDDVISRQAVIKATCDYCDRQDHCDEICAEVELIKEVPSVHSKLEKNSKELENKNGELISRQKAIEAIEEMQKPIMRSNFSHEQFIFRGMSEARQAIIELPSVQPEIIRCKDCRKHNIKVGFDENFHTVWKEDACPLVDWRGKAKGHEFDYQFCCCAERRADEGLD